MRLLILATLVLACGGTRTRGTGTTKPAPVAIRVPQRTTEVRVVVTAQAITLNGVPVRGKPMVADIKAILGVPDRTWESGGANRIHTWDKLGVLVYEPYDADGSSGDGRCTSITFPYKAMMSSFTPQTLFGGSIELDGKPLTPSLTLATVLGWSGATQPYTKQSLVFDRGEFHVFALEERPNTRLDLVEFSFWQQRAPTDRPRRQIPRVTDLDEDDCTQGAVQRCTSRALAYQTGVAGRRNFERVFELMRTACAGGDVFGCVVLGNMHDAGKGTPQNKAEARTAYKRACALGYQPAC